MVALIRALCAPPNNESDGRKRGADAERAHLYSCRRLFSGLPAALSLTAVLLRCIFCAACSSGAALFCAHLRSRRPLLPREPRPHSSSTLFHFHAAGARAQLAGRFFPLLPLLLLPRALVRAHGRRRRPERGKLALTNSTPPNAGGRGRDFPRCTRRGLLACVVRPNSARSFFLCRIVVCSLTRRVVCSCSEAPVAAGERRVSHKL